MRMELLFRKSIPKKKEIAIALYDFPGGRKSQISFRKEDLFLVDPTSKNCNKLKREKRVTGCPTIIFKFLTGS